MGIIILPFLLIALIAFITSIIMIISSLTKKELILKDFYQGFLITVGSYLLIFIVYILSDEAYALGPVFIFPFFMILTPFFISLILRIMNTQKTYRISYSLLISIIISGIFILIFNKFTFGIIEYLEIQQYH